VTVLIISDDAEFSRNVVNRWQTERSVPNLVVVSTSAWQGGSAAFDLAIVPPVAGEKLLPILQSLEPPGVPVICGAADSAVAEQLRESSPRVLVLRPQEGWLDTLVLLAGEVIRRLEASARLRHAEESLASASREATLGRYVLEMRHSLNNALTSVLGHAELLLLDPGSLPAEARDQVDIIHNMAGRMHEILQRFSSLDTEMHFAQKYAQAAIKAGAAPSN